MHLIRVCFCLLPAGVGSELAERAQLARHLHRAAGDRRRAGPDRV